GAGGRAPPRAPREVDAGDRRAARHDAAELRDAALDHGHDPRAQPEEGRLSMARTKKYPGYVERHGRGFRVTLTLAGKRHRYSVRAESKSAAGEWASAKYEELQAAGERRDQGYPAPLRMSELFDRFEREWMPGTAAATQNSYKDSLKVLRPWFVDELHNPTVDRVRAGDVAAFMTWRRSHRLRGT